MLPEASLCMPSHPGPVLTITCSVTEDLRTDECFAGEQKGLTDYHSHNISHPRNGTTISTSTIPASSRYARIPNERIHRFNQKEAHGLGITSEAPPLRSPLRLLVTRIIPDAFQDV